MRESRKVPVLDHVYVELVDWMGDDLKVANAARMSLGKRHDEFTESDARLIRELGQHYNERKGHSTPFRHCSLTFNIKWPIFVARQGMRHNIGITWNEKSLRWTSSKPEFWMPTKAHKRMEDVYNECAFSYEAMLEDGVPPEIARVVLPLATYTEVMVTMTLEALAWWLHLRHDFHAQAQIQEYAIAILPLAGHLFPISLAALLDIDERCFEEEDDE